MASSLTLICPKCSMPGEFNVTAGWSDLVCEKCKKQFRCLLATIRGKRSRGNKKAGSREYSVRVLFEGNEKLIEYDVSDYHDFEMRSKDEVAFVYYRGNLCAIYNLTIGQRQIIRSGPSLIVIFLVIVAILVIIAMLAGSH